MKTNFINLKLDSIGSANYLSSPLSSWFFSEVQRQPKYAHHSLCSCFDNHLIRIGGYPFCLGCFCLAFGAFICFSTLVFLNIMDFVHPFLLSCLITESFGLVLFIPTLFQPFLQIKVFKIFSRTSLGAAIVMLCYGGIFLLPFSPFGFFLRFIFAVTFVTVFKFSMFYRKKFSNDPAQGCNKGCYPFCSGNIVNLKRVQKELIERADPNDPLLDFVKKLIESMNSQAKPC